MSTAMLWALARKEFYKIRWLWLVLLGINLAALGYVFLETRAMFRAEHAEMVWYQVLQLGRMPYAPLKYLPLTSGILLGMAQFLPEMRRERLRLSLHLPVAPELLVLSLLTMGLGALGVLLLTDVVFLQLIMAPHFPAEALALIQATFLPWAVSGVAAYLGSGLVLLEPAPRRRVLYMVMAASVSYLGLTSAAPGALAPTLPLLILLALLFVPGVLLPAYNYRYRSAQ